MSIISANLPDFLGRRPHRLGTISSIAMLAALAPSGVLAQAQQADDAGAGDRAVEEIVVTGSRLPATELTSPSPLTVMSREDIELTGLNSVGEVLRELPSSGAQSQTDTAGRGNSGIATVALRGLESVNTLVLLNGHRLLAANASGTPDLNSIPFQAIERMEILKDGASAVYGADAIAGVVNFIMQDDFDGLRLDAEYGQSTRDDARNREISVTFGKQFERGGLVIVASHRDQDGFLIADRPCCRDADQRSQGGLNLRDPLPIPAAVKGLDPDNPDMEFIIREGVDQATSLDDFRPFFNPLFPPITTDREPDGFNFFAFESSQSEINLDNIWFDGHLDIVPEFVTGFVQVAWNHRESLGFLAPDAFGEVFGDPVIVEANNDFNPFGVDLSVARTIIEQDMEDIRQNNVDSTTRRIIFGLRGDIADPRGYNWNWDISYNSQRLDQFTFGGNGVIRHRIQQAAGDSDECRAARNGCVPINLLGAAGTVTQEMLDFISRPTFEDRNAGLDAFQFNLNGVLFSLPAGEVPLAAGVEYREESFELRNDAFSNEGAIIFRGQSADADPPLRKVKELYFETSVPVFANKLLVRSLEVDFALRWSDFNQFGTTTNPKVGVRWRPVGSLLLRGSFGTGFRSPTFDEAFAGQSRGFRNITDPCEGPEFASFPGCMGMQAPPVTGAFVLSGGNPDLDPETSDNFTAGAVFTPDALPGLAVTVDYFRIEKEDIIRSADVNFIIDQNVRFGRFPDRVERDENFRIQQVTAILENLGNQTVEGIDFSAQYETPEFDFGAFNLRFDLTYLDKFAVSPAPGEAPVDRTNTFTTELGTLAPVRTNGSLTWKLGGLSASWSYRFVGSVTNIDGFFLETQKVDSFVQNDVSVSYTFEPFGFATTLTAGMENVFDEDPPFVEGNFSNGFDTGTFNSRGRFFFFRLQTNFEVG